MRARIAASAVLVWVLFGHVCAADQAAEDAALAAARTRQDAVKTLIIEYKHTEVLARGAESEIESEIHPRRVKKTPVPDMEMTLESTNRLVIDGLKVRVEDNHPRWLAPEGKLLRTKEVAVCDGSIAKSFFSEGMRTDGNPMGYILTDPRLGDVKAAWLTPITLAVRGFQPAISPFRPGDMKRSGVTLPVGGAPCQEYVYEFSKDQDTTFWLDAGKDYVVRRIREKRRGRLYLQTDITSYRHEACGWIPTSWECNQYSSAGTATRTDKVEVLELRINEPVPADQFKLQFPPKTVVADTRNGTDYRVQPDGSMREITDSGELAGSVPQPGSPWYQERRMWFVGVVVLLIGAGILFLGRRRRRRSA